MNMFSRSKPIRALPLPTPSTKLPRNFAEKLLELESQLAYNLSVELISSLMELYSTAIEYYESIQDKKYLHYKERLHTLLSRKEVLDILSQGNVKKQANEMPKITEVHTPKIGSRKPRTLNSTIPVQKKDADEVITVHLHESSSASSRIKESLRDQEGDKLEKRIQARKRASSLKPQNKVEPPPAKSANKLEMYQNDIEAIMEKYAEEKLLRVQEIKNKYKDFQENSSLEGNGKRYAEILKRVREEMEKNMKLEIDEVQQEILRERREKIAILRDKYET